MAAFIADGIRQQRFAAQGTGDKKRDIIQAHAEIVQDETPVFARQPSLPPTKAAIGTEG
jgi:hypothetical protein